MILALNIWWEPHYIEGDLKAIGNTQAERMQRLWSRSAGAVQLEGMILALLTRIGS
jgi:hypothetical protein